MKENLRGLPRFVKVLFWLLTLCVAVIIFYLSHQRAAQSDAVSGGFIGSLLSLFNRQFESLSEAERADAIQSLQHIVRTAAHMSEYFALGFLLFGAMNSSFSGLWGRLPVSFVLCVLYAVSDELHQYFIPGRSCQMVDIIVDSTGALLGMVILWLIVKLVTRKERA